ncbi:hypothetical protein Y1Q_0009797 [Alligator mississippiensis]|uniref:Uncharacterized protein n=1 Tax=Alligator mississippiensis TaxID=8496 RepID=A0A151MWU2_ALLMI|nr:hypothetical protein Y1Q_0009797 [Alligator mississippiensis]
MAYENMQDRADWKLQKQLLALEREWVVVLWEQTSVLGRAVQATDNDRQVLDTVLALVVAFVPPTSWPLTLTPPAPW